MLFPIVKIKFSQGQPRNQHRYLEIGVSCYMHIALKVLRKSFAYWFASFAVIHKSCSAVTYIPKGPSWGVDFHSTLQTSDRDYSSLNSIKMTNKLFLPRCSCASSPYWVPWLQINEIILHVALGTPQRPQRNGGHSMWWRSEVFYEDMNQNTNFRKCGKCVMERRIQICRKKNRSTKNTKMQIKSHRLWIKLMNLIH